MLAAKCTRASSLEKKHQMHICTFICTLGRNESCSGCAWPETVLVTLLIAHPELGEALSSCKDVFPEGLCILPPWEQGALSGQGPRRWMLEFTVPYSHLAGLGEALGLGGGFALPAGPTWLLPCPTWACGSELSEVSVPAGRVTTPLARGRGTGLAFPCRERLGLAQQECVCRNVCESRAAAPAGCRPCSPSSLPTVGLPSSPSVLNCI